MINPVYSPGASRVSQLEDDFQALENIHFTQEELQAINQTLSQL